jgi:hypothetical protein
MNKLLVIKITLGILGALLVFHFLIITGLIPYDQVWAGRLQSKSELLYFEGISIAVNTFMVFVLLIKYRFESLKKEPRIINWVIWLFALFFLLNTMGNLFAKSIWELIFGTLVTAALTVSCIYIAKRKRNHSN